MTVALYTTPDCVLSDLTRAAFTARGIEFSEICAAEHADHLAEMGPVRTPVVTVDVESELVTWQAHQPRLIELLANLMASSPVSVEELFEPDAPALCVVTRLQVIGAIRARGLRLAEYFSAHGDQPLYSGATLRTWLGPKAELCIQRDKPGS